MTDVTHTTVADFAAKAFISFRHAGATGDWTDYLALLSNDYSFHYPVPGPFAGMNRGKERFVAYCDHVSVERGIRVDISVPTQTSVGASGSETAGTVVFESDVTGTVEGEPIRTSMAVSMDVRDGQIVGHREFIGDIRPFVSEQPSTEDNRPSVSSQARLQWSPAPHRGSAGRSHWRSPARAPRSR